MEHNIYSPARCGDYEFKTVIDADDIKGTKHTKDECALLSMLNAGHIGIIPTLF